MSDDTLQISEISPSEIQVTWTVKDFLTEGSVKEWIAPGFPFAGFACFITVKNKRPFNVDFVVLCKLATASDPRMLCKLALRSKEGTPYDIPIREGEYHVTSDSTILFSDIPWDEFYGKRESLAPGGVLTVICNLNTPKSLADGGPSTTKVKPVKMDLRQASSNFKTSDGTKETSSSTKGIRDSHAQVQMNVPVDDKVEHFGSVKTRIDFPSRLEITWTVKDFFKLPCDLTRGVVTERFLLPGGWGFLSLHPYGTYDKEGLVKLSIIVVCDRQEGIRNPEVDCELAALKTAQNTFYKSLPGEAHESMGDLGCLFHHYFRLSEIVDRNDSLVPDGVFTAFIVLSSHKFATEEASIRKSGSSDELQSEQGASATPEPCDGTKETSSITEGTEDSFFRPVPQGQMNLPTGVKTENSIPLKARTRTEITWTVKDFFELPCDLTEGVVSERFLLPGGCGFIGLHPCATHDKQGLVLISIRVLSSQQEGIRNPEVNCELAALKTAQNTLHKCLPDKADNKVGESEYVFDRYFRRSEIVEGKDSLVPDGVLTAVIVLSSHNFATEGGSSDELQSEQGASAPPESCDGDLEQVLTGLSLSGKDKSVTISTGGKTFKTCMSILCLRAPAFASEIHERLKDAQTSTVDIDDLCRLSAFRLFLEFVNTGDVQHLTKETAFELYVTADRFKMEELKELCAKRTKESEPKFMIFNA